MPEEEKNSVLFKKLKKFKQEKNLKQYHACREKIILENIELVYWISKKFFYAKISDEDITQVGVIGLMNAIDRYDVTKGTRFSSFAVPTIIGEIKRYIRDKGTLIHIPRRIYESKVKISKIVNSSDRSMSIEDILKEHPDVTRREVLDYVNDLSRSVISSDYLLESGYEISENKYNEVFDDKFRFIQHEIAAFPAHEQKIIKLYYVENYTQIEIARKLGCSQMHISRLLRRISDKLAAKKKSSEEDEKNL